MLAILLQDDPPLWPRVVRLNGPTGTGESAEKMNTGYYLKGGSIYGPTGYTGYRINRRRQILGHKGYTRHWIHGNHIYSSLEGNTGYYIEKDQICGPTDELPWDQAAQTRRKRMKKKAALRRRPQTSP